jgi:serine/threonine protein kinase
MGNCVTNSSALGLSKRKAVLTSDTKIHTRHSSEEFESGSDRFQYDTIVLGNGADAIVYLGRDTALGINVAVKVLSLDGIHESARAERVQSYEIECAILSSLNHDGVVQLLEHRRSSYKAVMVLEYAEGGDLNDRIKRQGRLTEPEAAAVISTLADALSYVHSMNIVHRDVKMENVLLRSQDNVHDVILTDFGFAAYSKDNDLIDVYGSSSYMAPEITGGRAPYGKAVDVWSLGVLMYVSLAGYLPYFHKDSNNVRRNKIDDVLLFKADKEVWRTVSRDAKNLILGMLAADPHERFTMDEVLAHPWITKHQEAPEHVQDGPWSV